MNPQRGFTLLELLVAIAIFAIMAAITYSGLTYILEQSERLKIIQAQQGDLTMALLRLEDDLAHARARDVRAIDGATLPAFLGQAADTRALGLPALDFTRGGNPIISGIELADDKPHSDLLRISYRLDDQGVMRRLIWPVLDRAPVSAAREAVLLEGVEEFKLRFFSQNGWSDTWPPLEDFQQVETLPRGVEITFKLAEFGEITRLFLING